MKEEFPSVHQATLTDLQRQIIELLGKSGKTSWSEIVSGLDVSKPTVHSHIRKLEDRGIVRVESEGNRNFCKLSDDAMEYL